MFEHVVVALLAFVPLLLVRPGVVTDDTKTYLYLDPGRFLSQIASMWNPDVALGTVTHETIGYLLPMGPFFWLASVVHLPIWVAQRLWLGAILMAAGAGVLYLCRTLNVGGPGPLVAALAFMLSPYFLQYAGRISVILLPWAGLPWMVGLAAKALRRGGWRYPALFALVVAVVSGINASSVLYVGLAPVAWLAYAVAVEREARWRDALVVAVKIAVLTLAVCLWWIVGLQIEAAYGVNVLKFTETIPATSQTSTASEVLRGLGYWYFYGGDRDGPWTFSSVVYTEWIWVLVLSFLLPALSFVSAVIVRWRYRAYFVAILVLGVVLSVGAHPYDNPTPLGGLLKAFMTKTTAGLAMRSTDRATPLVVLGTAMLLGAGVTALWRRFSLTGLVAAVALCGLVVANNPALFNGDTIANGMTQPARLPSYEYQAAKHLNADHPGYRVLAIPGNDFAVYDWGDTVDTPQPALLHDRPFAIQEQQIMGSMATADMLYASDEGILDGTEDWNALAPMARLMSAADVLVENDTNYWRYGIPPPQVISEELRSTPKGLSDPVTFGQPQDDVSSFSTVDEQIEALPANAPAPHPLVTYSVDHPRPIVRAESNDGAVVVAGDDSGLENLAATGMLDTTSAVYFAGTLAHRTAQLEDLLRGGASLVVTDTNRKQAFRWDALTANTGYTEQSGQDVAAHDPSDSPLRLFPGTGSDEQTTAYDIGAVSVTASSYGDQVSYLPENRPYMAVDGNPDTAWETATFVPDPSGQWWQIRLEHAITAASVTLTQPLTGNRTRWITQATLTFDGGRPVTVRLTKASRRPGGQVVHFSPRRFSTLRVRIDATSDDRAPFLTAGPVGLSGVVIPGVTVLEVVKMPTGLLGAVGPASLSHRLTYVMTRERVSPYPVRTDPEPSMVREFNVPTTRTFTLSGTASVSALLPDDAIDRLMGRPGADGSGVVAYSSGRDPGDLTSGAAAAIDGSTSTFWQPGFGASHQLGSWLEYNLPQPITFDHMELEVVADGRHSVPTAITVSTENGTRHLTLPPIADSRVQDAVTSVPLRFPALTGSRIRITFTGVRLESAVNEDSPTPIALPLGIAELGIPGLHAPPDPPSLPGTCRSDLLAIDGQPIDVAVTGSTAAARQGQEMTLSGCGPDAAGVTLGPGPHLLTTAVGHEAGWQIDQLVLDSSPGGGPSPTYSPSALSAPRPGPTPRLSARSTGPTSYHVEVSNATVPFELVLGESVDPGWRAVATPLPGARPGAHPVDLGPSQLIDGFANGWPVTRSDLAALGGSGFTVSVTWTPQSHEWAALGISAAAIVVCLLLAFLPAPVRRRFARRLRRRKHATPHAAPAALGTGVRARGPDPEAEGPELASPAQPAVDRGLPLWAAVLVGAGTSAVAVALSYPLAGLAAGLATLGALVLRPARLVTTITAVALVVAAGATVVVGQVHQHLAESSNWPGLYEGAGVLALMAVVFLGADATAEVARRLAGRRAGPSGAEGQPGKPPA